MYIIVIIDFIKCEYAKGTDTHPELICCKILAQF